MNLAHLVWLIVVAGDPAIISCLKGDGRERTDRISGHALLGLKSGSPGLRSRARAEKRRRGRIHGERGDILLHDTPEPVGTGTVMRERVVSA